MFVDIEPLLIALLAGRRPGVRWLWEGCTEAIFGSCGPCAGPLRNPASAPGKCGQILTALTSGRGTSACGILENAMLPLRNSPLAVCRRRVSRKVVGRYILRGGGREKRASQTPKTGPQSFVDGETLSLTSFRRPVAEGTIRERILKACGFGFGFGSVLLGCRGDDPGEDTESFPHLPGVPGCHAQSCRGDDPGEDTERF